MSAVYVNHLPCVPYPMISSYLHGSFFAVRYVLHGKQKQKIVSRRFEFARKRRMTLVDLIPVEDSLENHSSCNEGNDIELSDRLGFRIGDPDVTSLSSSPSSLKVRLRNTFLEFKEDPEIPLLDVESPRADSLDVDVGVSSPLRRSHSDVTGVDIYIRQRLGSNIGIPTDFTDIDADSAFSPVARISPMSRLSSGEQPKKETAVSILSFSPPTFQQSPFADQSTASSDFVMVMEEDPPLANARIRTPSIALPKEVSSSISTEPNTPAFQNRPPVDDRTTVMLRNIPNKYTQRMLLAEVDGLGFGGQYDFFYLPIDYRNKCNVGYCFISFVNNEFARVFMEKLNGYKLPGFNSQKICEVSWARVQGLRANIQHYRNSPVNSVNVPEYRPLLFAHGTEIQFPFVNSGRPT
jgi:hypothetical protein